MSDTDKLVAAVLAAGAMASVPDPEYAKNATVAMSVYSKILEELTRHNANQ